MRKLKMNKLMEQYFEPDLPDPFRTTIFFSLIDTQNKTIEESIKLAVNTSVSVPEIWTIIDAKEDNTKIDQRIFLRENPANFMNLYIDVIDNKNPK